MEPTNRPLNTLEPGEVDAYIDSAIDQLFVPKAARPSADPEGSAPTESMPEGAAGSGPTSPAGAPHPLEALQEALLSLEWEVSERNIRAFEREVRAVGQRFPADRHVGAVVQMASGVSKYLTTVGEGASPLGVQFPTAVLRTLEVLVREPAPPAAERKTAVEKLLEKYRRLQAEVRRPASKDTPAEPSQEEAAPQEGTPAAESPAPAVPVEELEPEPEGASRLEELEPEAAEELEPEAEARPAEEERIEPVPESAAVPGADLAAEGPAAGVGEELFPGATDVQRPEPESEPPSVEPESSAPEVEAPPLTPPLASPPEEEPPPETAQLVACLEVLRADVRDGVDRVFRAAAAGTEALDAELTQFRHLLDDGLSAALELAGGLSPALQAGSRPTLPPVDVRGDLERVRRGLADLGASLQALEERLGREIGPAAPPAGAQTGPEAAPAAPVLPTAPESAPRAPPVCLVSVGGSTLEVLAHLVVNAVPVTPRQASQIRERGYATLKDLRKPFRSIKNGLSGPLVERSGGELGRLHFPLAASSKDPHGVVLLSDGTTYAAVLTDTVPDRSARPRGDRPLLSLEEGGTGS